ncbi:armadillo repeat protein deleted in velo-cardio-facial syndrome-like isoform X4 [Vespa mandarinia]|uniref:armadillo repeat protein deleted in velo-cardio-facial syndrome-like isoform X4 n=1 Tax=Vespa mandarinia TaxID=7446 RepID=UPI001612677E|nr:armadillo repeat protein deleted in velo-cardio-facial syndrome-like isoform X4 [Vespa mandarinia]XP_035718639.1 armadillo repeat protein deleted in velo-cardio-facial syndrome-like isoform X4 [Vespa mandarinia]XP_035718640.1 armadillo repeat protein deleted in velo-cardio-facial syndrome-like isoform X4 [Vespa mandarinia]
MSNNQLVDSCLRVLQDKGSDMPQYTGQSDADYHGSNGQADTHSLHSSHLSVQEDPLLIRTHKQQTSQQVTTVTKVVREVSHMEPDPGAVSYMSVPLMSQEYQHADPRYPADPYMVSFDHYDPYLGYPPQPGYPGPHGIYMPRSHSPHSPHSPSEHSRASPPHEYLRKAAPFVEGGYNDIDPGLNPALQDHYRITPSPGGPGDQYDQISNSWNMDDSGEPSQHPHDESKVAYGYVSPSPYGPVGYGPGVGVGPVPVLNDVPGYDEGHPIPLSSGVPPGIFEDEVHLQRLQSGHPVVPGMASPLDDDQKSMRWRDPNLSEVIGFLSSSDNIIKANAAAYLQHLCYMDDPNKQKTRSLGGIPPLVQLLNHDDPDVYRNACGALRNLSYGRQNDENKRAIKNAGGVPALIHLLRMTLDADVKELVTGVLWNLSSCEDLKRSIIDDGVTMVVKNIIIPHSGWDPSSSSGETCWSTVFRNASGVLRNVSSAGEYARKKLRECDGLVDALLYVVRSAIEKSNIGNKIVENCVCILRNLSYRCQEVEDPNYDKHPIQSAVQNRVAAPVKGENLGCFGGSKKKKDGQPVQKENATSRTTSPRTEPVRGMELLWQPEVVQSYLSLLQTCSNPETLEAAAGALQNLAACYWQPSIEIRAAVRKDKGLPILVELLRMEVDRVVCAVATALRNLAIDQRNKELIGKYAMRDLIQKLPSGNNQHDQGTSDDTIAAVLATLNEVIKKNAEFSRSLLDAGGVDRLMNITRQRQKYTPRVLKFAGQVLFTMWQHQELRDVYKKHGWKEQDFVTKTVAARNSGPNSPNNANSYDCSTLNRPMASQGSTRYEDRTIQRANINSNNVGRPTIYQSCLVEFPILTQKIFRPPEDCSICWDVQNVEKISNVDPVHFEERYAYSGRPVIIMDAMTNWTATKIFSYSFFKSLYGGEQAGCQFFPYKTEFRSLLDVFNMSQSRSLLEAGTKPWYVGCGGWCGELMCIRRSNCDGEIGTVLRQHYQRPYFLPPTAESEKTDWIFMGSHGYGAPMHVDDVEHPSWQAQIRGEKLWILQPPRECHYTCKQLEVVVRTGEIIVLDTNRWYHQTKIVSEDMSITIGAEYD